MLLGWKKVRDLLLQSDVVKEESLHRGGAGSPVLRQQLQRGVVVTVPCQGLVGDDGCVLPA